MHKNQLGDAFLAARLARLAIQFEEPDMVRYWIAQARARGADNRHELDTRIILYTSIGDWSALEKIASVLNGSRAADTLGIALMNQNMPAEARTAYLKALEMMGYEENTPLTVRTAFTMLGLLWTEQQLGMDNVLPRVAEMEAFLSQDTSSKSLVQLAQLASIRGDKADVLKYLNKAANNHRLFHQTVQNDVMFAALRDDPEFIAIIDKVRSHAMQEKRKLEKSENADAIFGRVESVKSEKAK